MIVLPILEPGIWYLVPRTYMLFPSARNSHVVLRTARQPRGR